MKEKLIYSKKLYLVILLLISGVIFSSCRVTLIPDYNSTVADQIEKTAKDVDLFYLKMLETTSDENDERAFVNFTEDYVKIEVDIVALLNKNKIRPYNENSTKICELTLNLWKKYKEEHKKDNTLSNGVIKINRVYMGDMFNAMQVAENAKKIIANPPN